MKFTEPSKQYEEKAREDILVTAFVRQSGEKDMLPKC